MKIIFLQNIPRLGKKYEVQEVADGYGRHLIMTKVAMIATPDAIAQVEKKKAFDAAQKNVHQDLLMKNLENLNGVSITMHGKANEKGHLFASIHKEAVIAELKRVTRLDMNPDYVMLKKPIKETGVYEVPVVVNDHRAVFTVVVEEGQ